MLELTSNRNDDALNKEILYETSDEKELIWNQ